MKKIIALFLAVVMVGSLAACDKEISENLSNQETQEENKGKEPETIDDKTGAAIFEVDSFIQQYNESATMPITDIVEVDVTDKESGHYRTEFRLNAFSNSEARTGKIGDAIVDIVCYGRNNEYIRIYVDRIDLEKVKDIVKTASPIMDSELSDSNISDTLAYIDMHEEANGYYYGNIGMLLLGESLMLKVE